MIYFAEALSKEEDKVPEFQGEPNAFALEIVAAHPDHQNSLMSLFEAAFHCFSDREYCVITIPSTVSVSKEFKYFARVARRPTGEFPHELYVMHRNSLFGDVQAKVINLDYDTRIICEFILICRNHRKILLFVCLDRMSEQTFFYLEKGA